MAQSACMITSSACDAAKQWYSKRDDRRGGGRGERRGDAYIINRRLVTRDEEGVRR